MHHDCILSQINAVSLLSAVRLSCPDPSCDDPTAVKSEWNMLVFVPKKKKEFKIRLSTTSLYQNLLNSIFCRSLHLAMVYRQLKNNYCCFCNARFYTCRIEQRISYHITVQLMRVHRIHTI